MYYYVHVGKSYSEEHTSNLDKYQAGSTRIATIAPDSQLKIAGDQSHVQSHDQAVESHDQGEDSSDKIHSIKLSELAYGDFVTRFGDLFVDGFAVKDDIANAVLSYKRCVKVKYCSYYIVFSTDHRLTPFVRLTQKKATHLMLCIATYITDMYVHSVSIEYILCCYRYCI